MVTRINPPDEDSIDVIETVISERKKFLSFYKAIAGDLKTQFNTYKACKGNPEHLKPLNLLKYTKSEQEAIDRKKSLINLYTPAQKKFPFRILEKMRKKHRLIYCPSCGEDGTPGTLDHYLPKEIFPELAICIDNLTPMCTTCQGHKSTHYLTVKHKKAYFHPYYDHAKKCLFHIDIIPPYQRPSGFKVCVADIIDKDYKRLIESHIDGIRLKERIEEYCESKHLHLLRLIADEREYEDPLTARQLIRIYCKQEEVKTFNSWGAIYYRSVLNNPSLLKYLDSGELPKFL